MSPAAFNDPDSYLVRPGWSLYMADGRSEMNLGVPAMVTSAREGWAASGHVGRVIPNDQTDAAWIWLALRTRHAAIQLKAKASGSVVDSTFPEDAETIILPPRLDTDLDAVSRAWEAFADAQRLEERAVDIFDEELAALSGVGDVDDLEVDELPDT
jgi:hypothetical protein